MISRHVLTWHNRCCRGKWIMMIGDLLLQISSQWICTTIWKLLWIAMLVTKSRNWSDLPYLGTRCNPVLGMPSPLLRNQSMCLKCGCNFSHYPTTLVRSQLVYMHNHNSPTLPKASHAATIPNCSKYSQSTHNCHWSQTATATTAGCTLYQTTLHPKPSNHSDRAPHTRTQRWQGSV